MQIGEHWFSMQDPEGAPQGYARLVVTDAGEGARHFAWELHLAFPGGTYEEERTAVFDATGRMTETTYADGTNDVRAQRDEGRLVGTWRDGSGAKEIDLEIEDDAIAGMGFVLVASLPFEEGFERTHADLNEAKGFEAEGRCTLRMGGHETIQLPEGEVTAWRGGLVRSDGRELPIWLDEDRRILQADWGGGNLMVLHPGSTRHLFRPAPPVVQQLERGNLSTLVVEGRYAGTVPDELFRWWTTPELLTRWWPETAEVGERLGGAYVLAWPQRGWTLRGQITAFEPGRRLAFTWAWDHMPDKPELAVDVTFGAHEGGTRLRIVQGPYRDGDREERDGHWQGWQSVCARLEAALANA